MMETAVLAIAIRSQVVVRQRDSVAWGSARDSWHETRIASVLSVLEPPEW